MSTEVSKPLDRHAVETITAAARGMYPHDALPDAVYGRVAAKLAEAAGEDGGPAEAIARGVEQLDGTGDGTPFAERDAAARLEALRAIEGSEFFELVRGVAVVEVYSDPITWSALGYEGPSFDKGGYLERGFDDLDWLPDPGEER